MLVKLTPSRTFRRLAAVSSSLCRLHSRVDHRMRAPNTSVSRPMDKVSRQMIILIALMSKSSMSSLANTPEAWTSMSSRHCLSRALQQLTLTRPPFDDVITDMPAEKSRRSSSLGSGQRSGSPSSSSSAGGADGAKESFPTSSLRFRLRGGSVTGTFQYVPDDSVVVVVVVELS